LKTIALVEYNWIGHYVFYIKAFAKIFIQCGYRVAIYCKNPSEIMAWVHKEFAEHESEIRVYNLTVPSIRILAPLLQRHSMLALQRWLICLCRLITTRSLPDYVFFLSIDNFIIPWPITWCINLIFQYEWFCLFVHPDSFRTTMPAFYAKYDFLSIFRLRKCKAVFVFDEGVVVDFAKTINRSIIHAIPDIADVSVNEQAGRDLKRVLIEKANGRKIVGLFSPVRENKGTMTLIDVALTTKNSNLFFFLCGLFLESGYSRANYSKIKLLQGKCPENMHFVSGFIEDEGVYNSLFRSVDIIFAAFVNYYSSSNTLTKAAFFKKPVVVSKGYCMASRVEMYNLGISVPESNVPECSKALDELDSNYLEYVSRADFTNYYLHHSKQALLPIVKKVI